MCNIINLLNKLILKRIGLIVLFHIYKGGYKTYKRVGYILMYLKSNIDQGTETICLLIRNYM